MHCPKCGEGSLFNGLLTLVTHCPACNEDLSAQDPGDGPAFFAITIVGFLVVGLAAWVEIAYKPEFWVHIVLWIPFVFLTSIFFLRLFKSLLITYQYAFNIGFNEDDDTSD